MFVRSKARLLPIGASIALGASMLLPAPAAHASGSCASPSGDITTLTTASASGTVTSSDRSDWYRSSIDASQVAVFLLENVGGDADLYIWNYQCTTVLAQSTLGGSVDVAVGHKDPSYPLDPNVKVEVRYYSAPSGSVSYTLTGVL